MKKLALSKAVFILPVFLLIVSCHKDLIKEGLHVKVQGKDAPNYYFNWETAQSMPVSSSSSVQPSMPWQSQSGSY